jgi:transposase
MRGSWPSSETCCAPRRARCRRRPLRPERRSHAAATVAGDADRGNTAAQPSLGASEPGHRDAYCLVDCGPARVDGAQAAAIRQSPVGREQDDRLSRLPGVGRGWSRMLLAALPELGTLSSKPLAALVGIAPLHRDRGTLRGNRMMWGGRAVVRPALNRAAWVATKWTPIIRTF